MSDSGHGTAGTGETAETVTILYENYRGETAVRRITPIGREWFRSSEWHPEPQWLFSAFDMEAFRDFARAGVKAWGQAAVDAALASPRADSDERTAGDVLTEACKPWEHYTGEPPDDGSPLSGVFVAGMAYTERLLAKLLDVTHYEGGDGSEDFDADATQTLRNILTGARLWDADENRPVSATPAQPAGPVPDSLREALEFYADPQNWRDTPPWDGDPECITEKAIPVSKEEGRPCDCGDVARAALKAIASHPVGQSAGSGAETVWTHPHLPSVAKAAVAEAQAINAALAPDSTRTGQAQAEEAAQRAMDLIWAQIEGKREELFERDGFGDGYYRFGDGGKVFIVISNNEARALLAARPAAPEAQGAERQPIETAPKDRSQILLFGALKDSRAKPSWFIGAWFPIGEHGEGWWVSSCVEVIATEWALLPAPPASSGQGNKPNSGE